MAVRATWQHRLQKAKDGAWNTVKYNWHLGVTAFGGPPVHFKIVSRKHTGRLEDASDRRLCSSMTSSW